MCVWSLKLWSVRNWDEGVLEIGPEGSLSARLVPPHSIAPRGIVKPQVQRYSSFTRSTLTKSNKGNPLTLSSCRLVVYFLRNVCCCFCFFLWRSVLIGFQQLVINFVILFIGNGLSCFCCLNLGLEDLEISVSL